MIQKKILFLFSGVLVLFIIFSLQSFAGAETGTAGKKKEGSVKAARQTCASCHADFKSVLPTAHPPVKGNSITACVPCHKYSKNENQKSNTFSAKLHRAHTNANTSVDCVVCHSWKPGSRFSVPGSSKSLGVLSADDMKLEQSIFTLWSGGPYLDALHGKANIVCSQCHGSVIPQPDTTVENGVCLGCHGPAESLAKKTEPKDFADRNPHKSHLGDINCVVCHKGHTASTVICLDCHKKFNMKIKGEAASEQNR